MTKRRWGDPRPLLFVQSDAYKGATRLPLNFYEASGLLVIGAVGVRPCLPALGLMVVSRFVDESLSVSHRRRRFVIEK